MHADNVTIYAIADNPKKLIQNYSKRSQLFNLLGR